MGHPHFFRLISYRILSSSLVSLCLKMGRSKSALSAIRLAYAYMFQMDITRGFEDDMVKSATGILTKNSMFQSKHIILQIR
jgi:hypothetical protein